MSKRILVFSDGTGNAGGLTPDENRTNVYKLYRATRSDPESRVDASRQVAIYDPGLGTNLGSTLTIGFLRRLHNLLSQMTGMGISTNIIDCYASIIRVWEPGDRIYLFGFSRGAYTARCLGGVLGMCGIPTKAADGTDLKLDPDSIRSIATDAVRHVYEHGLTTKQPRFADQRDALAKRFRQTHQSYEGAKSGAVPHVIAVWDTVAALGLAPVKFAIVVAGLCLLAVLSVAIASALLISIWWLVMFFAGLLLSALDQQWLAPEISPFMEYNERNFRPLFQFTLFLVGILAIGTYLRKRLKFSKHTGQNVLKTLHLIWWRVKFYDTMFDTRIKYARHALSIDEYRKDFARVPWGNLRDALRPERDGIPEQLQQIWFAGNHADIGGGYSEQESRLSDIALRWVGDFISKELPAEERVDVDEFYLRPTPSPDGVMHDECKRGIGGRSSIKWPERRRLVPDNAPLHSTVYDRLRLERVRSYDGYGPYRPEPLRDHVKAKEYF